MGWEARLIHTSWLSLRKNIEGRSLPARPVSENGSASLTYDYSESTGSCSIESVGPAPQRRTAIHGQVSLLAAPAGRRSRNWRSSGVC